MKKKQKIKANQSTAHKAQLLRDLPGLRAVFFSIQTNMKTGVLRMRFSAAIAACEHRSGRNASRSMSVVFCKEKSHLKTSLLCILSSKESIKKRNWALQFLNLPGLRAVFFDSSQKKIVRQASTKSANQKFCGCGGAALCEKQKLLVGFRGGFLHTFLRQKKV